MPATAASVGAPQGLAIDGGGNLYISTGVKIRRVSANGIITSYASGASGFAGDGGPALGASFGFPVGLTLDKVGNLYIADLTNNRVRLVQANPSPSIIASQKGLTFVASTGGGVPASQSFTIVNGGQGTLNWGVSASTLSGGNWLSVIPASGASTAGNAGPPVQTSVNPAGLAAGDYYGQVQIRANGAANSPQSVTVVLTVRAPGAGTGSVVQPSGLLFTATTGGAASANQSFTLTTLSTSPVSFSGTASFGGPAWFTISPTSGNTVSGKPATVQIVPNIAGLAAGVYNGNITFAFSDNSAQSVQLLLVISASAGGANQPNVPGERLAACAPAKLLPLFTSLGSGFSLTTGWPSPVELQVVDDCGQPLTKGAVTTSFSNTDPSLTLNSLGDGRWTGTWQAQNATANVSVSANASNADQSLSGSSQVSGGLNKNANPPPLVVPGGVLNAASYQLQGGLAPGSLVSIFGSLLAQGAVSAPSLPLTSTLGGTTVTIAGRKLPLLFAGPDQVNAMIPYDLAINASHQVVVQRGTALSNPEAISGVVVAIGRFYEGSDGYGDGDRGEGDGGRNAIDGGRGQSGARL